MIPRFKPSLGLQELKAAFTLPRHDDVECFEKAFAAKMEEKYAIAFPYGRTGLMLLLEALGLKDKEIICPAYTCVVVPHAIVFSGNIPVFVDSQEEDLNMDLDLVPEAITDKTGAIIATSIFGYPVDLDKLDKIRAKYPLIHIIQDCAHSFAAEWKGRPIQKQGVAAIYGLNISKIITSIFGGMVTTDDKELAQKLRQLSDSRLKPPTLLKSFRRLVYLLSVYPAFWPPMYGLINKLERSGLLNRFVKYYDEGAIDMPVDHLEKMINIEARVGIQQLKKYDAIIENRRKLAKLYNDQLVNIEELKPPPLIKGATYSHYVPLTEHRNNLMSFLLKNGVQLGEIIEYSIPDMKAYCNFKFSLNKKPYSNYFSFRTINLPITNNISPRDVRYITSLLSKCQIG